MKLTRYLLIGTSVLFSLALTVHMYIQNFLSAHASPKNSLASEECTNDPSTPTTNPNKLLFISCGGFLE